MDLEINQETKVPLYAVIMAIPATAVALLYIFTAYTSAVNAEKTNEKQDLRIDANREILTDIRMRLIRIEGALAVRRDKND